MVEADKWLNATIGFIDSVFRIAVVAWNYLTALFGWSLCEYD